MPKRLLVLNALLVVVAALSVLYIARQFMTPMPMPPAPRNRPAPAGPTASSGGDGARPSAAAYAVVSARNLFSPTRTEAPPTPVTGASAVPLVKPNLYGVVLREGAPIAYLEDPTTKRVAGYRVGDSIIGGTIQTISSDSVVIGRPDGNVDIRLRDPGKPRPAAAAAVQPQPGVPPQPGAPAGVPSASLPGVIPPAATRPIAPQPGVVPPAVAGQPPGAPIVPGRRTLPPNLLRRFPQQAPPSDAPQN
jgi:hypothetical protein